MSRDDDIEEVTIRVERYGDQEVTLYAIDLAKDAGGLGRRSERFVRMRVSGAAVDRSWDALERAARRDVHISLGTWYRPWGTSAFDATDW